MCLVKISKEFTFCEFCSEYFCSKMYRFHYFSFQDNLCHTTSTFRSRCKLQKFSLYAFNIITCLHIVNILKTIYRRSEKFPINSLAYWPFIFLTLQESHQNHSRSSLAVRGSAYKTQVPRLDSPNKLFYLNKKILTLHGEVIDYLFLVPFAFPVPTSPSHTLWSGIQGHNPYVCWWL